MDFWYVFFMTCAILQPGVFAKQCSSKRAAAKPSRAKTQTKRGRAQVIALLLSPLLHPVLLLLLLFLLMVLLLILLLLLPLLLLLRLLLLLLLVLLPPL